MDYKQQPPYNEPPPPYSAQPGGAQAQAGPIGSQPMPAGFVQHPGQPQSGVPTTTVIVAVQGFGPYPTQTTCTKCHNSVMTETLANPGLLTWILSGTLLLIGCWAGCCLIPCCIPECQDIEHRCPNCKAHLGTFRRL